MKRLILLIIACACFLSAHAAYLRNVPMTLTQPDGTVLHCYASGDEFFNYLHDENGFTIMRNPQTGFFVYADKRDGNLVATEFVAGSVDPASKNLRPFNLISPEEWMAKRNAWNEYERPVVHRDGLPNHGTLNNLSIFLRFSDDEELTNSYFDIDNMFNDVSENAISMRSYFRAASYGAIEIPTTFYPGHDGDAIISYQDTYPRSYFEPYDASTNPNGYQGDDDRRNREFSLLERAVNYINNNYPVPTSLNIDYDNDGYVDNVCFIVKGGVGAWSSLLWPHKWALYDRTVRINGKQVWTFNFQLADGAGYFETTVMCHEMNHSLGAPDLYHYYNGTNLSPVGMWDLMENNADPPQHCGAYMKMRYGHWIDAIPEITQAGTYTLNPISSSTPTNIAYKIQSDDPYQYYVLEYRDKTSLFETALPGSGLLIYRIDTRFDGNANYDPSSGIYDEVYLFRPGGSSTVNGDLYSAHFSAEVGRTEFNSSTSTYPFFTNGTPDYNFSIYNITSAGNTISFTYGSSSDCEPPTNIVANVEGNNVTLSWDAASNAQSYNIYRGGHHIGNTSGTTFTDANIAYGEYNYVLKSVDANGLLSTASESVFVTVVPEGSIFIGDDNEVMDQYLPSYVYYNYTLSQQIYTVDELGDAGVITSIAFYNGGEEKTRNYDFYLKATDKSMFSDNYDWVVVAASDKVFSGSVTLAANDWTIVSLDNPFSYDGISNVVLVTDDNTGSWVSATSCRVFNAPSQSIRIYSDNVNYNPIDPMGYNGTIMNVKNQLILTKVTAPTDPIDITVSANPSIGGTVSGGGSYLFGEVCTVTATANEGYYFLGWTENEEVVSMDLEFSFTVVQERDLVAHFAEGTMIGDGGEATNQYLPSYSYYNYSLTQQIYTVEELGTAGMITSIAFYNGGTEKTRTYEFYMKSTGKSTFSNGTDWEVVTESDKVFSGSVTMVAGDWTYVVFDTPFIYDGTSNVVLVADDNTGSYSSGMQCRVFDAPGQAIRIYSDGTNYDPYAPSSYSGTVLDVKNQLLLIKESLGDCVRPTNFMAIEIGPDFVTFDWRENGASEEWYIFYGENLENGVIVDHHPYTLMGLTPESSYQANVIPTCGIDDPNSSFASNLITFTTLEACPAPRDEEVSAITGNTATVTWAGYSESYLVQLGVVNIATLVSEDFESVIPSDWSNDASYPWTLVDGHMQSGNGGVGNSTSSISVTVTYLVDGTISFDFWSRGEGQDSYNWDKSRFYIDDELVFDYGAHSDWESYSGTVTAGTHTFKWEYKKDGSVNPTGDCFIVDNVEMKSGETVWEESVLVAGTEYTFRGLTPETGYCVRVAGVCGDTETEWSEPVMFTTTDQTTVVQEFALSSGANWASFKVEVTLDDLKAALVEVLPDSEITIQDQGSNTKYNPATHRWTGRLSALDLSKMYKISVADDCGVTLEGMPVNPADHPATISNGANWIAFPLDEGMSPANAFAGFAQAGDKLQSQTQNASYNGTRWTGQLNTLEPGQGYIYQSSVEGDRTLVFPASAK